MSPKVFCVSGTSRQCKFKKVLLGTSEDKLNPSITIIPCHSEIKIMERKLNFQNMFVVMAWDSKLHVIILWCVISMKLNIG